MFKLYSIISGSSGNASLISNGKTNILIDCGTSGKRICEALAKLSLSEKSLNAIVVTHEHIDHTKGVGVLARKLKIPVYATRGTHNCSDLGKLHDNQIKEVEIDVTYDICGIGVTPFSIPHDAADPCGYIFSNGEKKFATATDIGIMTDSILSRLYGCDSVLLESNHDVDMLRYGDYPYALKQRILSDIGHLSNDAAADTAIKLIENGTKHIMLGHLSDKNNTPEIAQMVTYSRLCDKGIKVGTDITLQIAQRYAITEFMNGDIR